MEKNDLDFRIPKAVMWFLVILCYLFSINWIWPFIAGDDILYRTFLNFIVQTPVIVLFISDIYRSKMHQKSTWIIPIILIPLLGMPLYLINRRKIVEKQLKRDLAKAD